MSAKSVLLEPQHLLDPTLEHTLIVVKPDGYARGLTGEILRRIEAKGYTIKGLKLMIASRELLAEHYADHKDKPFFEGLLEFMSSGPVVAIIVEGQRVVEGMRAMDIPDFSVQNHPEAAAGPNDGERLFDRYISQMTAAKETH